MTNKIKVGIIDDEKHGRDYISLLLKNEFPSLEIIFFAANVEEAVSLLNSNNPNILFLDVELGNKTVFDVLNQTDLEGVQLIFTTAYEQYSIRAIKNDANDYLLKPIQLDEFLEAVNKAIGKLEKQTFSNDELSPSVYLPTKNGISKIAVSNIVRCEADSNYTSIFLTDQNSRIMLSKTLQEVEQQFTMYGFFRIHHKHLINMQHIVEYIKGKGGEVLLTDGTILPVSLRRKVEFLKLLKASHSHK